MPSNPFRFEIAADRWAFVNRSELLARLGALKGERGRRLLLYGRRRMGKTSLFLEAARRSRLATVRDDLSGASDLSTVANRLLAQVPKPPAKILDRLLSRLSTIKFGAGQFTVSLEPRAKETAESGFQVIVRALELIESYAAETDTGLTVYLDEFQMLRHLCGDQAEWMLRSVIQHHHHLNYVFSGSEFRLVQWMTDPGAAFYKQMDLVKVGPIDPAEMSAWIDQRTAAGGLPPVRLGQAIVEAAGPCTGDIVRLARTVFDLSSAGQTAGVIDRAMHAIAIAEHNDEFAAYWANLTPIQRGVLRALAAGKSAQSGATVSAYGLGSPSAAQKASQRLTEIKLASRDENNRLVIDSPFFAHWIRTFERLDPRR